MATPNPVLVQIAPNQITYGFYTLSGNRLTMCHDDGEPVDINGMTFTHDMRANDNPDSIAAVLTGKIRKLMMGEKIEGFNDVLAYPREGIA